MSARTDNERFRGDANKYAAYLETPEGRLHSDLAFANLQDFIGMPQVDDSLHALDVGCGTGAAALRFWIPLPRCWI
jgi:ubiquinone/menaquinone biosynthesis C-methylase UbiE